MNRLLLLLGAAGLLLTAGCRKDDLLDCAPTPVPPIATSNLSLAEFTRHNSVPVQTFTINVNQNQAIRTTGGATLNFLANSLLKRNDSVATGMAQVRLREIYSVPDMVLANMPTVKINAGDLLVSGGEFNIQVWQSAARLRLAGPPRYNPVGRLVLQSPIPSAQDTTPQLLWQLPATFLGTDSLGWLGSSAPPVQSSGGLYQASIPLDSIGWWNIDQLWHIYQGASIVRVEVETLANTVSETRVYLRPMGYNGLSRLLPSGSAGTRWQQTMPVGADMVAVVLQSINGQLYYGTQRVTIQSGLVIKPPVAAVSEAEAVRLIRQL
jgi:hypothetical protein